MDGLQQENGAQVSTLIERLAKAELHIHIEGSLEPEQMFELAARNRRPLKFRSVDEVRAAYDFRNLQEFLDIYYEGAQVLLEEQDFFDMALAYLARAAAEGVRRAEIFFDPQTHTERGVPFAVVTGGLTRALDVARARWGLEGALILCFLRHLSADAASRTFDEMLPFRDRLLGVGLDSSEVGHPPEKFKEVFDRARAEGLHVVAHAGEEGPPAYIWQALDVLGAERIDHGVRCLEDRALTERLVKDQVPLTVCPLSNVKLRVVERIEDHGLKRMLDRGLLVTVNSDDPAYFGGYLNANFRAVQQGLGLTDDEIRQLAANSFTAAFIDDEVRRRWLDEVAAA